jgi:hypothetical protein
MKQYSFALLVLLLSAVSNFMAIPCQAQTASDSNINTNNISPEKVSSKDNRESPVSNADNSVNSKQTVISENTENNSPASSNKANPRIPIGSRIFAAPSMEQ